MSVIRQRFDPEMIKDITRAVLDELEQIDIRRKISRGQQVAITVGSREIAGIAEVARTVVDFVRSCRGVPFIVPAMGSHGGATAAGQSSLLAGLGIIERNTSLSVSGDWVPTTFDCDGNLISPFVK